MKTGLFNLSGKVAIVTGGNGGIGLGMARGLAEAGAAVAIVGRNEAKSAAAVAELDAKRRQGDRRGGRRHRQGRGRRHGRARRRRSRPHRYPRQQCRHQHPQTAARARDRRVEQRDRTNLTSAFLCSQAVYPAMKAAGSGKVINIGSMMSIFGASFASAYAASKGGIVQYTRSCAMPGRPTTSRSMRCCRAGSTPTSPARAQAGRGLHERVLARTPAARWGEIDDFAGIAVFLASPASISSRARRSPSMAAFRSWPRPGRTPSDNAKKKPRTSPGL